MSRGPDIIRWVIERMMAHEDSITQELALTIEREARHEWGGQRIDYVAKHCQADIEARRQAQGAKTVPPRAVQQYLDGAPLPSITAEHGISRRTLYRALKRR
ncbi:MAG: helix-turn-helix domain-containing protein [Rhodocyclaceae bacterium]|nr:helix-turn-helix domain-containing protein [Rhodocyclaceae bacterium]